jgi:hypothetical protein
VVRLEFQFYTQKKKKMILNQITENESFRTYTLKKLQFKTQKIGFFQIAYKRVFFKNTKF